MRYGIGGFIIGAVTQMLGFGWFVSHGEGLIINPIGAIVNIVLCIVYCIVINEIMG